MKSFLILVACNVFMVYALWGKWDILIVLSGAFYYAYKRFLIDFADNMLK